MRPCPANSLYHSSDRIVKIESLLAPIDYWIANLVPFSGSSAPGATPGLTSGSRPLHFLALQSPPLPLGSHL
jgi:hypothetical protein